MSSDRSTVSFPLSFDCWLITKLKLYSSVGESSFMHQDSDRRHWSNSFHFDFNFRLWFRHKSGFVSAPTEKQQLRFFRRRKTTSKSKRRIKWDELSVNRLATNEKAFAFKPLRCCSCDIPKESGKTNINFHFPKASPPPPSMFYSSVWLICSDFWRISVWRDIGDGLNEQFNNFP